MPSTQRARDDASRAPVQLTARGVVRRFPGVVALSGVDLDVRGGEVLAVVGENGAGKSTLMRILAGVDSADAGEVRVDGTRLEPGSVPAARAAGVALIHQELALCDNLSVAANIVLGCEPRRGFGRLDHAAAHHTARVVLERLGLDVPTSRPLGELSPGQRQLVEIARALAADARVLIMDEPTSSLSASEAERLLNVVEELRDQGVAVVSISHRLPEVLRVADRAVVLRDGELAGELSGDALTRDALVTLMAGEVDLAHLPPRAREPGDVALAVHGVVTHAHPGFPVDLTVREGEVVGLAGLVGAGRTELLETLFGVTPALQGELSVGGVVVTPRRPSEAVAAGLALVPEDRKLSGLVLESSVRENLSLPRLARDARAGLLNGAAEREQGARLVGELDVRPADDRRVAGTLSGGNQQKVVLGKWLGTEPRVLLLDEPTRGVDVAAKAEIHALVRRLADAGLAVLMASSEMEEVLLVPDRVLVMHEGRLAGELSGDTLDEQAVLRLATGGDPAVDELLGVGGHDDAHTDTPTRGDPGDPS